MNWFTRTLHPLWILGVLHTTAVFGQAETGLIAHWRFAPEHQLGNKVKPLFGGPDVTFDGPVRFTKDPLPPRVELAGQNESLRVAEDLSKALLPVRDMSAEAWVRVDRPLRWGGILTVIQDNGEFERGWVLGFVNSNFSFGLASETARKLTYTTAAATFETNRWFHVIGTYDGTNQLLYVNGELAGQSREQAGNLLYPPKAPVVIGAYQDDDEHHRLVGAIHEVRLYRRALAPDEIKTRYEKRRGDFPEPAPTPKRLELAYGPFVDWRDRSSAVVTWETDEPMPTRLELEAPLGAKRVLGSGMVSKRHEVRMTDLRPNLEHGYRIVGPSTDGVGLQSKRYVFDSSFYYEPVVAPGAETGRTESSTFEIAQRILKQTGVRDGYCLVLGATDGGLAVELVRQSRLDVVVIDSDATRVAAARKTLDQAGIYGVRASVHLAESAELPYGDLVANLIVSESALVSGAPPPFGASEVSRLLRPVGGSLVMGSSNVAARRQRDNWVAWLKAGKLESATFSDRDGLWIHLERGRLEGAGEWSHQYGSTDNTSCSQDDLVQGELQVAWWGDPGPRPMPDRGNRNPAPLSVNGRLFVQGNRILFGLDAYNGAILWSLSAPEVRRANVTRDCSNMAAAGNRLYVAHGRYCLGIDGQTGERRHRFEVVENTSPGAFEWGFVAASNEWLIGSRQKKDSHYLGDDGEWYEDYSPEQISRVTSDRLFSLNRETGAVRWTYRGGVILNSTITIADGMVLFLESRNPEAMASPTSRLSHEQLTDQYLVALDLRTGKQLWDKGHDMSACQFMTYLVYSQNTAIITGTDKDKKYHTFAFSAPAPNRPGGDDLESAIPGRLLWSDVHKEDKGHHSGHLQHPLVVGTAFYSDQRSFDLTTGKLLRTDLPERRGCGVMSAAKNSIFFRHYFHGMWDLTTNKRSQFEGIRTGCWLGLIPAGGMLLAPESSAGCSCTHAIQTSVGYVPKSLVKR